MTTTLHVLWGREAISRYRLGLIDNGVRLAHAAYAFDTPEAADLFVFGVREARDPDDWMLVTNPHDATRLGLPLRSRLIQAAREGNLPEVRHLIDLGVKPASSDELGMTALHWAARNGHEEVAELLLAHGAPIDAPAHRMHNETPLHMACRSAAPRASHVVEVLVRHDANVEARDSLGNRPLHLAVQGKDPHATSIGAKLSALQDVGRADPLSENDAGQTPLDVALSNLWDTDLPLRTACESLSDRATRQQSNEHARAKRLSETLYPTHPVLRRSIG